MPRSPEIFILDGTPGAAGRSVKWETIWRRYPKYFINHEPHRDLSRWTSAERKRPFIVYWNRFHTKVSSHATLAAAERAAARMAKGLAA